MNILHVRSVPEDLYQRLQKLAKQQSRSLSAQVIEMLKQALEEEERRLNQVEALKSIRGRRFTPPAGSPTSLDLLHDDRNR